MMSVTVPWWREDKHEAALSFISHHGRLHNRMPSRDDMFVAGTMWQVEWDRRHACEMAE